MIFDPSRLLLIAGPCSLENEDVCRAVAQALTSLAQAHPELRIVFKGSFDKANRTSGKGARGTGLAEGLALLALVRREYGFPVLTDVHESVQVDPVAKVCDVLQIPAFLSRQTDLLLAAAGTGRVVNVKKGQFLSPQEMEHVTAKLRQGGRRGDLANGAGHDVWLPQPGGRHALLLHHEAERLPDRVRRDAQRAAPRRRGGQERGPARVCAAARQGGARRGRRRAFHRDPSRPEHALSDGPNMIPLKELPGVVAGCIAVWKTVRSLGGS